MVQQMSPKDEVKWCSIIEALKKLVLHARIINIEQKYIETRIYMLTISIINKILPLQKSVVQMMSICLLPSLERE